MRAAEEVCGTTKGGKHLERETWWWNEEVQEREGRRMHSRNGRCRVETNRRRRIRTRREAKAAVAKAKHEAYKEWYDKMGPEEGERMIYKVAKAKIKKRHWGRECDKDQIGEILTDEVKIKERCREYFSNLLNVENARDQLGEVPAVEGPVQEVSSST